jgi:NAD(P)-dependent dehydrogenase (short-subunit alcohol dehydrogenase family)
MMRRNILDFSGQAVLITGGSSGIGRATALAFAEQGAAVAIGDLNEEEGRKSVALIEQRGGRALFAPTDVTRSKDVAALVEQTVRSFGRLDCAFNNAGISHPPQPIGELDEATFERVLAVDLRGVFLCLTYELRHMIEAGKGAIVNTASVAGLFPEAGSAAYVAAKHGVIGLTKTAAIENAERGIRVNALAPGWVRTPMTRKWDEDSAFNAQLKAATPMHRGAQPEEIAGTVLFLCSQAASYITGQTHIVDGAQTIRGLLPRRY